MNKAEKLERLETARHQLEEWRLYIEGEHLLLTNEIQGTGLTDYYRVFLFFTNNGRIERTEITWALAVVSFYPLKDLGGRWHLAMNGYGFDKHLEIGKLIEDYYKVQKLRLGRI